MAMGAVSGIKVDEPWFYSVEHRLFCCKKNGLILDECVKKRS